MVNKYIILYIRGILQRVGMVLLLRHLGCVVRSVIIQVYVERSTLVFASYMGGTIRILRGLECFGNKYFCGENG